jgi:hypothetical protein
VGAMTSLSEAVAPKGSCARVVNEAQLLGMWERFSSPSVVLNGAETRELAKLTEVVQDDMWTQYRDFLVEHQGKSLLVFYSDDGTPLRTLERFKGMIEGLSVRRAGKKTTELLQQRLFVRVQISPGVFLSVYLAHCPLPMTAGKSAWAIFAAGEKVCVRPRMLGHLGPEVVKFCFDRATCEPLVQHHRERFALENDSLQVPPGQKNLLKLLTFLLWTACCMHDGHGGFGWQVKEEMSDENFVKGVYVAIKSVRSSYGQLMDHLPEILPDLLEFDREEDFGRYNEDLWRQLWNALGLDPAYVHTFLDLHLRFEDGKLRARGSASHDPDLLEKVSGCLLAAWKLREFTTGRVLTLGSSARAVFVFILTGGNIFVKETIRLVNTNYYLNGWAKLGETELLFLAISALSSFPTDTFIASILEDDRVAKHIDRLEEEMREELAYVASLPFFVYERVAECAGCAPGDLRDRVQSATETGVAYVWNQVFTVARGRPWNLTYGNKGANLEALKDPNAPKEVEEASSNFQQLMRRGYPKEPLVEVLEDIEDSGWSNNGGEQQHASGAVTVEAHDRMMLKTVCEKAFLHHTRPLVRPDKVPAKETILEQRAKKLAEPLNGATGRNMYYKELCDDAKARYGLEKLPEDTRKRFFAEHGKLYAGLPQRKKRKLDAAAVHKNLKDSVEQQKELQSVTAALELRRSRRHAEEQEKAPLLLLSNAKLGKQVVEGLTSSYNSGRFTRLHVAKLRKEAMRAPPVPSLERQNQLLAVQLPRAVAPPRPLWLAKLAWNRNHCREIALVFPRPPLAPEYFKFVYAKQQPQGATFIPMKKIARLEPEGDAESITDQMWFGEDIDNSWRHMFEKEFLDYRRAHELPVVPLEEIEVLDGCCFIGGKRVGSFGSRQPLPDFLGTLPTDAKGGEQSEPGPKKPTRRDLFLQKYPWAAKYMPPPEKKPRQPAPAAPCSAWPLGRSRRRERSGRRSVP